MRDKEQDRVDGGTDETETPKEAVHRQLEGSNAGVLMSDEMGANAMAHGETVDFDRLHEESLADAAEIEQKYAAAERGREG